MVGLQPQGFCGRLDGVLCAKRAGPARVVRDDRERRAEELGEVGASGGGGPQPSDDVGRGPERARDRKRGRARRRPPGVVGADRRPQDAGGGAAEVLPEGRSELPCGRCEGRCDRFHAAGGQHELTGACGAAEEEAEDAAGGLLQLEAPRKGPHRADYRFRQPGLGGPLQGLLARQVGVLGQQSAASARDPLVGPAVHLQAVPRNGGHGGGCLVGNVHVRHPLSENVPRVAQRVVVGVELLRQILRAEVAEFPSAKAGGVGVRHFSRPNESTRVR